LKQLAILALLLVALATGGCSHFARHKRPADEAAPTGPEQPPAPAFIGKVALVNEELKFALIETTLTDFPLPGTALKCMRNGQEAAIVTVSPERKRPFVSADIVKGSPQQGDEVYQ
jgi:hypothetical protein